MESKWLKEKEYLEQSILLDHKSYEELGREYGCTGSNIKKVAKRLGIELPQKRAINECEMFNRKYKTHTCLNCGTIFEHKPGYSNKYCSNNCEKEHKHKLLYQKIIDGDPSVMRANYSPKPFKEDILKE